EVQFLSFARNRDLLRGRLGFGAAGVPRRARDALSRSQGAGEQGVDRPPIERSRLRRRAAALLMVVIAPVASTDTTPVVMRSRIVSMYRRRPSTSTCFRSSSIVDRSTRRRLVASSPAIVLNA